MTNEAETREDVIEAERIAFGPERNRSVPAEDFHRIISEVTARRLAAEKD